MRDDDMRVTARGVGEPTDGAIESASAEGGWARTSSYSRADARRKSRIAMWRRMAARKAAAVLLLGRRRGEGRLMIYYCPLCLLVKWGDDRAGGEERREDDDKMMYRK